MEFHYTNERNVQIVLALLKANNIRKIVASPGATNESIVASMQYDPYFEMYSCVDERSAAYMACGLAAESGETVVLSCTGATSSRNYLPGLTEAFYRRLPILAITSSMRTSNIGHLHAQCTNRSTPPVDAVKASYCIESVKDADDEWDRMIKVNKAISDLKRNGGGPVHLNLITRGCSDYSIKELPSINKISHYFINEELPSLDNKKVLIFMGEHRPWTEDETNAIDNFCANHNTVALCDHTSGYKGKYRVLSALTACQEIQNNKSLFTCDILIHIGGISGDYYTLGAIKASEVWRVDEDGEIRDRLKKLSAVFEMAPKYFFQYYSRNIHKKEDRLLEAFHTATDSLSKKIPELPFSNIWIASLLSNEIPDNSVVHLGILNSLRAWNFFETKESVRTYCNVGGFGIDGIMSSLIGASLCDKNRLYFAVLGDLAFFYDINSLGNRHIGNNVRIMVINNGRGVEFHTYKHSASKFGEDTDKYIAAYGHNGKQSPSLVKGISESLGFKYISAHNKEEFQQNYSDFASEEQTDCPIVFEAFTEKIDDADVLRLIRTIDGAYNPSIIKKVGKKVLNTIKTKI